MKHPAINRTLLPLAASLALLLAACHKDDNGVMSPEAAPPADSTTAPPADDTAPPPEDTAPPPQTDNDASMQPTEMPPPAEGAQLPTDTPANPENPDTPTDSTAPPQN
jgi:hypothetical protein